jgi:hypothetical protein
MPTAQDVSVVARLVPSDLFVHHFGTRTFAHGAPQ